ncbi:OLC1v1005262C1 [Oldenlandia corymbosa var. corymbosa]|uniref:OLC1v1005262C1 n=1 Tax=Oldenlandia corymbosa var. corymbosa TaxID=529605 RepID=A0AAV1DHN2_OLDCO|nr:OLC1v1005262C1 [Oldenlandia corymbosa var. corymbosa]
MPDDSFVIDHKLLYNDLVGLICERVGWNRKNVNLSLSILYDTMRNGFRRIAKIKDDASLQVLYFLPSSTYIDLYIDLEVAGTSRSHLEVGTNRGRPNVENVDYMEDDDVGGPFMEDGDHMEYNHGEDDEDYTLISDQSDENQSISEGSRESDEEDGTTATIGIGTCFKNKEEAKNGIAAWNIEQKREFYVKESDGSTWYIWCKSLKESTPKGYVPCRWKVRASLRDHGLWEIVKWVPEHNCMNVTEENNNRNVSAMLIAHLIRHKVELDPDYEVNLVQEEVKDRMHADVPYHRAWKGRRKAIDLVYGDWVSLPQGMAKAIFENHEAFSKALKGLKVDGKPVEGMTPENSMAQWMAMCFRLLGITPVSDMFDGNKIYAECLINECLRPIPENAPREAYTQRARALLFLLIGGFLISDNTGNRIALWILAILEDLDLWVWERIPRLQPKRKVKDESYLVPDAPLGNRTWIFCWAIREPYEPNRVLRQFQCVQTVPEYPLINDIDRWNAIHHRCLGIGKAYDDWVQKHTKVRPRWNVRDQHVVPHELGDLELGPQCTSDYMPWFQKKTIRFMTDPTQYGPLAQGYHSSSSLERFYSSNLSDIYHLADAALWENPSLGGSLEDKLFQIFDKSFSALTLGPRDMSTQSDTQVLQKRPPESSQNVVLTQKTTSKPTGGGRRKRPEISDRTIIVHPNPTPMQEDDENDEGNESDEDYYIRGEEEEEEEESSLPRVSSQKKKKTVEVRKSDRSIIDGRWPATIEALRRQWGSAIVALRWTRPAALRRQRRSEIEERLRFYQKHINELGDDVMLDDALCIEVTSALKECGEDNSNDELGVDNVMVEEDALHKEISSVTKNNDLTVFTLVGKTARRYKRSSGNGDVCHERVKFRCGCPAYIHFTVDKDGLWTCTKHLVDHNHDLVPNEMIGLLRSQRKVDENDMKIIRDMKRSGIPLVDAFKFVAKLHGGSPNMKYTLRDVYNYERLGVGFEGAVRGEDLHCSQGNIDSYLPGDPFLESIRRVYTVEVFREVQQLHKDGMLCRQEQLEVSNDGNIVTYHVRRFGIEHFKHVVVHDTRLQRFSCTCRSSIANEGDGKAAGPLLWKALIMRRFSDLVYASEYNKDAKKCCDEAVDRLKEELGSFIGSNNNDESVDNDGVIKNSAVKRKKFGPRNERPKSIVEKACNKVRGRKTNARIAADRTKASVTSDLHYQSMPFPYPNGAAQDFTGSGSFAAVNASHQSVPSLNVNSSGFSFANPSVAAQHFSWVGASTSVNASDQSMPFINQNSGGFSFPIPKGASQEFQGESTSAAVNPSHQNMTFMNENFGGFSFPNRREAAR